MKVDGEDEDLFHGVERCMHTFILIACVPNNAIMHST